MIIIRQQSLSGLLSQTTLWILLSHLCFKSTAEVYINQFAVHIEGGRHVANRVARETGLRNIGQIGNLADYYLFEAPQRERRSASPSHDHHAVLREHSQVNWFEQQVAKSRRKRDFHPREVAEQMRVTDPNWKDQWYLNRGAYGGNDMNVLEAWKKGYTGKNIVVTILDDGLERTHPDLVKNYDPYASYDVNDRDSDPMPRYDPSNENRHGTRCAGEVSAEANNTYCTIGIAPHSRIGGIRMLDGEVYDAVEATSLSFNRSHIDIYSASWGPDDDGKVVDGPGKLAKKAFINGIEHGRNGKGSIFVWASGNGGSALDSCNCDGYANSIYTLSISSTSENGLKPWYLEECSSTLATTYSSGAYNEKQIASTDLHEKCTTTHTGTSASAPLAAGIVALILEANNDLTWRDVQYITLMTARPGPIRDGEWVTNGVGRQVSLRYGYGLMDASAMVDLALLWNTVPEKHECQVMSDVHSVTLTAHTKYQNEIHTDGCKGTSTEVNYLEHVQAVISLTYESRGNVVIYLTSPKGTRSQLLPHRPNDVNPGGFDEWPFLSVHFWGENPQGVWVLEIEDGDSFNSRDAGGTLGSWSLVFHGTEIQPVSLKNETAGLRPTTKAKVDDITVKTKADPLTQSCHQQCDGGCNGPTAQDCIKCKYFRIGPSRTCVSVCPEGFYTMNDMCFPCEISCATCIGPMLTDCRSCPSGHQLQHQVKGKLEQFICSADCLPGFFLSTNSCIPCHSSCQECLHSAADCTKCPQDFSLLGNTCVQVKVLKTSFTLENSAVIALLICLCVLSTLSVVFVIFFLRRYNYLCWKDKKFYGQVPIDDEDAVVRLTYSDDMDD
uniref:Lfur2 n=1 Tax=Lymnaea stagnalis TaxID=6523 RepID=Q26352_LYMST|nr:Lfur2 [Lymnaea stagnalis]